MKSTRPTVDPGRADEAEASAARQILALGIVASWSDFLLPRLQQQQQSTWAPGGDELYDRVLLRGP